MWCDFTVNGFNHAFEAYEIPTRGDARLINTYYYMAMFPAVPLEEMEAHGKRSEAAMQRAMSNLAERWDTEWLPEIKGFLDHWDTYDLGSASMPDLLDHLKDTLAKKKRLSEIHFLTVLPAYVAMGLSTTSTTIFSKMRVPSTPTGCSRALTTKPWKLTEPCGNSVERLWTRRKSEVFLKHTPFPRSYPLWRVPLPVRPFSAT
jgi:hypothetical protein